MPSTLRPEPLEFATSAPQYFHHEIDLDASPEAVFAVFADIDSWPRWFDDMRAARWTCEGGGLGATRHVELGALSADERFLAWEPGKRFSFRVETLTLPLVRAFVEDWRLEPREGGGTHLVWRVGYETTALGWLLHPLLRTIFNRQFGRTLRGLQQYLRS